MEPEPSNPTISPPSNNDVTLVFGGARSGKSRIAEALVLSRAAQENLQPIYIATSEIRDEEMRQRVSHHQDRRDSRWQTVEEPLDLHKILQTEATPGRILLVDCLTLWLSNQMEQHADITEASAQLAGSLQQTTCPIVLVSNEVGQGIVPINELARRFRDEAGRLNQTIAGLSQNVLFVAAGLTLPLKTNNVPMGPEYS